MEHVKPSWLDWILAHKSQLVSLVSLIILLVVHLDSTIEYMSQRQHDVRALAATVERLMNASYDQMRESPLDPDYHRFRMAKRVLTGRRYDELSLDRQVCLYTQSSVDYMSGLLDTVQHWSGPISLALFAPDVEYWLGLAYIGYLAKCNPDVGERVVFHFVYPEDYPIQRNGPTFEELQQIDMTCENPQWVLQQLMSLRSESMLVEWRDTFPLPLNTMRNVAKDGCNTEWRLIVDMDMIPSPDMDIQLEQFFIRTPVCEKCVYVVAIYEINEDHSGGYPRDKTELAQLAAKSIARPFYVEAYNAVQNSSNLPYWLSLPSQPQLDVAYKVENISFNWEPIFVHRAKVPDFPGRVLGHGMDRCLQTYELLCDSYDFYLLNNVFTSHWGFKQPSNPTWRTLQQRANDPLWAQYFQEVADKYGRDPHELSKNWMLHVYNRDAYKQEIDQRGFERWKEWRRQRDEQSRRIRRARQEAAAEAAEAAGNQSLFVETAEQ